jgi:restriction system protein
MNEQTARTLIVRAPVFPTYADLGYAIRAFEGEPVKRVRDTITAIWEQTGTPQNPVDWTNPDIWIQERLSGDLRNMATKIWHGSGKKLNPRHVYGCYLFINRLSLLDQSGGYYSMNERGQRFLANDETILRELDTGEGIPKVLSLVAERSPCKRGDILPPWSDYLKAVSLFSTPSTFADTLSRRLVNAVDRNLISRDGNTYSITDTGIEWLKGFPGSSDAVASAAVPSSKRTTVAEAARAHNEEQLAAFQSRLMSLEPAQFEHFIKDLLDAMDYEDVRVTKISGDKGVDVVARVQFGITEITEVVQVKRMEGTITRPIVDQLRGALGYHNAIRGTIITLGRFAQGAKDGALYPNMAPITLIDGKRLLELCIKHQVGIRRRPVEIYEVDDAFFAEKYNNEQVDGALPLTDTPDDDRSKRGSA